MKLTLANIKELKRNSDSPLLKRVCNYVIDRWSDYNDKKGIFTDVLHYSCQSGIVGELIYYSDTVRFYKQYRQEINTLLYDLMNGTGLYSPTELFGDKWDKEDPLAQDDYNQNLLPAKKQIRKICPETGECISDHAPLPDKSTDKRRQLLRRNISRTAKSCRFPRQKHLPGRKSDRFQTNFLPPGYLSFHLSMFYSASAILETNKFFSGFRPASELRTFFSNSAYNSSNFSAVCSGGFFSMRYR